MSVSHVFESSVKMEQQTVREIVVLIASTWDRPFVGVVEKFVSGVCRSKYRAAPLETYF